MSSDVWDIHESNNLAYFTLFSLKTVVSIARAKAGFQAESSISTWWFRTVISLDAPVNKYKYLDEFASMLAETI